MARKIALLFPGSGSQYVGMGKEIFEKFYAARKIFQEANEVLGYDLSKICFEGSIVRLNKTVNTLASVFTLSVAYYNVYLDLVGIPPDFLAGHSLGEYSALCCSGGISFSDGLQIIKKRAELAEQAGKQAQGAMTVLKNIAPEMVEKICLNLSDGGLTLNIACFNSPGQIIISGHEKLILAAEKEALKYGAEVVPFIGTPPYHSLLMKVILEDLKEELSKYEWKDLKYPVISNATASPYCLRTDIIDRLILQMYNPVLWQQTVNYLVNQNVDTVIEIGPQNVLKNLVRENTDKLLAFSIDDKNDERHIRYLAEEKHNFSDGYLKTGEITPDMKVKAIAMCLGIAVSTRNNNPDESAHKDFAKAYNAIKEILESIDERENNVSDSQVFEALRMLKAIFDSRGTPYDEQKLRFRQIAEKTGVSILTGH